MRFLFIDLENVRSNGLEGVLSLEAEDQVFIFYSENANNLTIPTLENINNSKATVKFINTNFIGSNAMDFQIVSLLGAMIERHKKGFFSIISHDNGFKSALTFCERYFTDYPISLGKFDNIISAIAYDLKHPVTGDTEGKVTIKKKKKGDAGKNQTKQTDEKAVITGRRDEQQQQQQQQKQERQSGQGERQNENAGDKTGDQNGVRKQENGKNDKADKKNDGEKNVSSQGEKEKASGEKKEGRNRRRRRQNVSNTEEPAQNKQNTAPVTAGPDMQYIYEYLKGFLSVKTIDIYASKIHEALLVSNTKDELHKFFKNRCGEDEGEALFKLLQGDFENMKRQARK
ncbi:MAG: hypothetical protein K6E95_03510 [Lachnospiraceae bacterium]|nr:hypothetical protein [Lachnospiraceae bacterium]